MILVTLGCATTSQLAVRSDTCPESNMRVGLKKHNNVIEFISMVVVNLVTLVTPKGATKLNLLFSKPDFINAGDMIWVTL